MDYSNQGALLLEQVTRFELARPTWKDGMLPLHHTCIDCLLFRVQSNRAAVINLLSTIP